MMTKLAALTTATVLATSLATAGVAQAQPGLAPLAAPAAPAYVEETVELRSPATATVLSFAGTIIPALMVVSGDDELAGWGLLASTVTPSLGHWYAGRVFTPGMGARAIGGTLFVAGALSAFASSCWDCEYDDGDDGGAALMLGLGAATYIGGIAYDLATAGDAARAYNREHGRRLHLAPTMVSTGASPGVGMGLAGAF